MQKQFEYKLKEPISIAIDGKQEKASEVIVKCPRPYDRENALVLESIFTQSIGKSLSMFKDLQNTSDSQSKDDESADAKADSIVSLIMMGSDSSSIKSLNNVLRDLICEGNQENPQATINGQKFTKPIFDDLSLVDIKAILGRYIYSFLSSTLT